MDSVSYDISYEVLTIKLSGHIDSLNASQVEEEIKKIRENRKDLPVVIDAEKLEYISSAGLRIILRLLQEGKDVKIINVSSEVYEVLEMTGFTEMMEVKKAYRVISIENAEVIGQGANGKIYRIDRDTIVKVFLEPDSLDEIQHERELARTAFVLGVPSAIPYDVVRIASGGYGSVFELLNAKSLGDLLKNGDRTVDEIVKMSIALLKIIHGTVVKPETMPDMKNIALDWADFLKDHLAAEQWRKLHDLVAAVPDDDHMIHGDYHIKNVMLQNGECLLIDMDTLCHGHPVFELASMFNAYGGYAETDHNVIRDFLGVSYETGVEFFDKSLRAYLNSEDDAFIKTVKEKAQIVGYARMMRRSIRRNGLNTEAGRKEIENCRQHLADLLLRVDTLTF